MGRRQIRVCDKIQVLLLPSQCGICPTLRSNNRRGTFERRTLKLEKRLDDNPLRVGPPQGPRVVKRLPAETDFGDQRVMGDPRRLDRLVSAGGVNLEVIETVDVFVRAE